MENPETPTIPPCFIVKAIGSGRPVTEQSGGGRPHVIFLHDLQNTEAAETTHLALRDAYPNFRTIGITHVVHLPGLDEDDRARAKGDLADFDHRLATSIQTTNADEYIYVCPDWEGTIASGFGIEDPTKTPAAALLDKNAQVVEVITEDLATRVLKQLRPLIMDRADVPEL